jgi:aminopeptidase N
VIKSVYTQIQLVDYRPPEFLVDEIALTFKLSEDKTIVHARYRCRNNPALSGDGRTLQLQGEQIQLMDLAIDNEPVADEHLTVDDKSLSISEVPEKFVIDITTRINPENNSSLSGLYLSSGMFCTQCEAEGFRRITYFPDRPDVLARFSTRIEARKEKFPVLLSNGNLTGQGLLENGFHYAEWHDPFPKPSYLFALVAGDLVSLEDTYETCSGRNIDLQIYVQPRNGMKCSHAMESLKKSMQWDEDVFGLEYDLDQYMVVAVDDFNMGAMENKGLNIFNSKYVLALPESATDQDYLGIEGVIGHEYFHNWTGNRVTCRDWFQLSLKEGLTVFRDQEFSADMNSRAVQRIKDVRILRQFQFPEDDGPLAHPVRPASYLEINNFYTVTIYNKGAEVVRMIHTLLGPKLFREGMDLYFARHDGQAVTCDDFVAAMASVSGRNLQQFKRWYSQAGTPELTIAESYDNKTGEYHICISQNCPSTPGQTEKKPFHIPILIGLLDSKGTDIADTHGSSYETRGTSVLLELIEVQQNFVFHGLKEKPHLSFLRMFSAPVKVGSFHSRKELEFFMGHDSDSFNRWDAAFSLSESIIGDLISVFAGRLRATLEKTYVEAVRRNLIDTRADKSLISLALQLPAETYLKQTMGIVDPDSLHAAHQFVKKELSRLLRLDFIEVYRKNESLESYQITPVEVGRRSLKNVCLDYLVSGAESGDEILQLCRKQYFGTNNMTDQFAVLSAVVHQQIPERDELLADFERIFSEDPLLMDKWFSLQAFSSAEDTFSRVQDLMTHPVFTLKNPNKVRSLVGAFCQNHFHFHAKNGDGYRYLSEIIIELDGLNPQMAARMVTPLIGWKRYDKLRQVMIVRELERIQRKDDVSRDVYEIVTKCLKT